MKLARLGKTVSFVVFRADFEFEIGFSNKGGMFFLIFRVWLQFSIFTVYFQPYILFSDIFL